MGRYVVRRLLWAVVLFVAVTMITYVIFFVIPADPAVLAAGRSARPADVARVRHYLGLDHSVPYQYGLFLKRLIVDQSLGRSFVNRRAVNSMVGQAAPVTASLVFGGAILRMLLALPNALLPVVTMLGMDIAIALGGAIFTEYIFGLPGLGRLAVQSLMSFDLPTIEGVVVFATLCIIILNLVVDVLYAFIDPRIRLE